MCINPDHTDYLIIDPVLLDTVEANEMTYAEAAVEAKCCPKTIYNHLEKRKKK